MNKSEIRKNRLDLAYKRNLQILNAIMFLGVGGLITYFAGLIITSGKVFQYTVILILLAILTYIFYNNVNDRLKNISKEIENLEK